MEQYFILSAPDGFEINGVLNWKEKSDKLVIFCHGLTWYGAEAHYVYGKDFFVNKWYEVVRFDYYNGGEKNRKLKSCSIDDHAKDTETVIEHFKNDYKEIYLVWHSLAWPSIVRMNKNVENISRIVFWDPAFDSREYMQGFEKIEDIFIFDGHDGRHIQVSEEIVTQRCEDHLEMLENMNFSSNNMSIIYAGANTKVKFQSQTDALWIESSVIEWADHGFTQEGKYEELFEKTLEFINR